MRIEIEELKPNKNGNTDILAFFRMVFYEEGTDIPFVKVNGCMIVTDSKPTPDGNKRLTVHFPFLHRSYQGGGVKHLLYFEEGDVKRRVVSDAVAQYNAQLAPLS